MTLKLADQGKILAFDIDDVMLYHGPGFPGGVAHAYKVLERALPLLGEEGTVERRDVRVGTAHRGPGVRDTMEMVLRAVTEDRFTVDSALERTDRGETLERYVFELGYRDNLVRLEIREGFVTDEFIQLGRKASRTDAEDVRLTALKQEMADRLLAAPADQVYDVVGD
ncbi:hypothetical protein GDN83_21600 [Gordonia jinghuaiqii]|uniref:Uncharacterized protein n=1 Tax=Gordonia jinghuaiqii TaxID=2758710 RepID=A0A7D7R0E6_9ACTN|nr:hypothetical protein [Gordonia jinghuaiqii]MCR5980301.1 hypothetical protein [Gordonia jinghuaiqii]QMT01951.1 hypothetical protein H1R19_01790 [Gordonia jinghuaiqii]